MKPNISFDYKGERQYLSNLKLVDVNGQNEVYQIDNDFFVTISKTDLGKLNAIHYCVWFENKGNKKSEIISNILDCDMLLPMAVPNIPQRGFLPTEGNACVISMKGTQNDYWEGNITSAAEFGFTKAYLDKKYNRTRSFCCQGACSSDITMPFFDVTANGKGYIVAIGWTGGWRAEFTAKENGIFAKTGLKETKFYLNPGEKVRTTSTLIMQYSESEDKYNSFRRIIAERFSHKVGKNNIRNGLLAFELWGGLSSDEMIKRINKIKSHNVNIEEIWIDAGWNGQSTNCKSSFEGDWSEFLGDWEMNKNTHPDQMLDVAKASGEANMKMMLWFEPERARSKVKVLKEHPEWFLSAEGETNHLLYYGNAEALEYIKNTLCYYIESLNMSCVRQDFNLPPEKFFAANEEENRKGIIEIKHIMGMYELWDFLCEKYPNLIIDNCASGGRRIDIESLKRTIPFFRTDYQCNFNTDPEILQVHNSGISHYLPFQGCTNKEANDTYAIRSTYSSSFGFAFYNATFQAVDKETLLWAKTITDEYLEIRDYFSKDFYNHGSVSYDDTSWTVWQYHNPETDSGIVLAFRRINSPFESMNISLKGLSGGEYVYNFIDNNTQTIAGKDIKITLTNKRSSLLIKYNKK